MIRLNITLTPELVAVIDRLRQYRHRNPEIEDLLWDSPAVKCEAFKWGVIRVPRRKRGKPPAVDSTAR